MKYTDDFDNVFESKDQALEEARDSMEICDYQDFFDFEKFFKWAMEQESFYEVFSEELASAEEYFFEEHYFPLEDEDDEE